MDLDPDPGHKYFLKINWHFEQKKNFSLFFLVSFIFMPKLDDMENFCFNSSDLGFKSKL